MLVFENCGIFISLRCLTECDVCFCRSHLKNLLAVGILASSSLCHKEAPSQTEQLNSVTCTN
jgi:hypothetical protein